MKHLGHDVSEVTDEVEEQRFGESCVMSESRWRRASEATDQTNQRRADQYNDERHDTLDYVQRHYVLDANHAELLKHPVQHLHK